MEANSQVNTAIIDDLRGIETLKSLKTEVQLVSNVFILWYGAQLVM